MSASDKSDPPRQRPNSNSALIIRALESKFRAQRDEAIANLSVCVNSPVGVGDHASHVEDCLKLINQISEADEGLKVIRHIFRGEE